MVRQKVISLMYYLYFDILFYFIDISGHSRAKFEIEQAQLYLMYRNVAKAEVHIDLACDILGLKYELVGKLGKRTKYQEEDIPQLALEISLLEREGIERPPVNICNVAQNMELNDNVRLEKVKFAISGEIQQFPNTEQKLILTIIQKMLISKPQDELFYEEIKPFIDVILTQNNTWPVRIATLLLRSRLEAKHNRTIERSMLQIGEILKCIKKEDPHPLTRVGGVYGCNLQPVWKTEAQQADVMLNLGLVKASLDIYLRLQLWEEVIVCYTILNMRHKAAEIIKQQLDVNPTVKLWCLLGKSSLIQWSNFELFQMNLRDAFEFWLLMLFNVIYLLKVTLPTILPVTKRRGKFRNVAVIEPKDTGANSYFLASSINSA